MRHFQWHPDRDRSCPCPVADYPSPVDPSVTHLGIPSTCAQPSRPGFQTGNVAQLAIAIARTFDPLPTRTYGFQKGDQQALTALMSFWLGTSFGRIGERLGNKRRLWLATSGILQMLMAATAALLGHFCGESPYAA